jgi:hypothetical protein
MNGFPVWVGQQVSETIFGLFPYDAPNTATSLRVLCIFPANRLHDAARPEVGQPDCDKLSMARLDDRR